MVDGAFEVSGQSSSVPQSDIELIIAGCAFMRHCQDDAATLSEPEWYAALSIVGRCEEGEELAHAWSSPHPAYSQEETADKVAHALGNAGPRTCEYIEGRTSMARCTVTSACIGEQSRAR